MGKRILVVESGIPVVPFEQSLLLRKEHELIRAATGAEALDKVRQFQPQLVITDDHVGDMPVVEMVRRIRESPEGRQCGVILLGMLPEALPGEGVNLVLPKPISGHDLNQACKKLLTIEARKEARLLVYVQVQGYLQSSMFLCNSINLSGSGILILTARRLKLGERLVLQVTLPREREKVRVSGVVVREAGEVSSRLNAYGVQFEDLSQEEKARIQHFVDEELRAKVQLGG